jgi:hypothetical protein
MLSSDRKYCKECGEEIPVARFGTKCEECEDKWIWGAEEGDCEECEIVETDKKELAVHQPHPWAGWKYKTKGIDVEKSNKCARELAKKYKTGPRYCEKCGSRIYVREGRDTCVCRGQYTID